MKGYASVCDKRAMPSSSGMVPLKARLKPDTTKAMFLGMCPTQPCIISDVLDWTKLKNDQ